MKKSYIDILSYVKKVKISDDLYLTNMLVMCDHLNLKKTICEKKVKHLINAGYLEKTRTNCYFLTEKGKEKLEQISQYKTLKWLPRISIFAKEITGILSFLAIVIPLVSLIFTIVRR